MLGSVFFPAWILGKRPETKVILSSYTLALARENASEARRVFSEQAVFPAILAQDTRSKTHWKTATGGGCYAAGVGGTLTGFGADVFVIDDYLKGWAEAQSQAQREKVWSWFHAVSSSRLSERGGMLVIATRWHGDDLIGRLLDAGGWESINFPAIATEDEQHRRKGEALSPRRFPIHVLEEKRRANRRIFSCLYQGDPAPSDAAIWQRSDIKRLYKAELPSDGAKILTADLTFGGQGTSNNAICEWILDESGVFLAHPEVGKWSIGRSVEIIREAHAKSPEIAGDSCIVELAAGGGAALEQLPFPATAYKLGGRSKIVRAEAVSGLVEAGRLHIPHEFVEFFEELCAFPGGRFDDCVDATIMALEEWSRRFAHGSGLQLWPEIEKIVQPLSDGKSWHANCIHICEVWRVSLPRCIVIAAAVRGDEQPVVFDFLDVSGTGVAEFVSEYLDKSKAWAPFPISRFFAPDPKKSVASESKTASALRKAGLPCTYLHPSSISSMTSAWADSPPIMRLSRRNVKHLFEKIKNQRQNAPLGAEVGAFLALCHVIGARKWATS
jgi:hypothetical protein